MTHYATKTAGSSYRDIILEPIQLNKSVSESEVDWLLTTNL